LAPSERASFFSRDAIHDGVGEELRDGEAALGARVADVPFDGNVVRVRILETHVRSPFGRRERRI
jgi:hypothetical protein